MKPLHTLALMLALSGCDQPAPPAPPREAAPVAAPPEPPAKPAPRPEPKSAPRPKPPESRMAGAAKPAEPPTVALPPLDLSLPDELLEDLEPGEPLQQEPLLPSLFGREVKRDYRLNGRLIESSDEDHLFEGAELRLEIRR